MQSSSHTHGLRDRRGGLSFKPRVLVFFGSRALGLERWLPPRAFVLGVALSALVLASLYTLYPLFLSSFFCVARCSVSVFMLAISGFSFCDSCSCLLLVLMSWGGYLRGWVCMLRCLCLLSCFALPQRKPFRCFLFHSMLASSSLVLSSCFLSICWFWALHLPASKPCCLKPSP